MKLAQVLESRENPKPLITAKPDATVQETVQLLCRESTSSILVTDEQEHLVGIITAQDLLARFACDTVETAAQTPLSEVMSRRLIIGHPDDDVHEMMAVMSAKRIHHLPILDQQSLVGVLSIGDILRALYEQDEIKVRYLGDYLGGTYGSSVY